MQLLAILPLSSMPNRADGDAVASNTVENHVRSPGDEQFPHFRLGTDPAQMRVTSQCLDDCDHSCSQTFDRVRFVESHKGMNLLQARSRERRPDKFDYRS